MELTGHLDGKYSRGRVLASMKRRDFFQNLADAGNFCAKASMASTTSTASPFGREEKNTKTHEFVGRHKEKWFVLVVSSDIIPQSFFEKILEI